MSLGLLQPYTIFSLPGSPATNPGSILDSNFQASQPAPNVQAFGSAPGDGSDATAAFQAAYAWLQARGGSAQVNVPAGSYRLSQAIPVDTPFTRWQGVGLGTVIIPTFDGCPFPIGSLANPGTTTYSEVRDMSFACGVTSTVGYGLEFRGCTFSAYRNILQQSFANCVKYGDPTLPLSSPNNGLIDGCTGGAKANGTAVQCYAGSSLILTGRTALSVLSGGVGIDLPSVGGQGAQDGLYMDVDVTIGAATCVNVHPSNGSVASIELRGNFVTPTADVVRVALSGTGTLHHLILDGTRVFGSGGASAENLIHYTNTGTGQFLLCRLTGVQAENLGAGVLFCDTTGGSVPLIERFVCTGALVDGVGEKTNNTYDVFDFGSAAHGSVNITGSTLEAGASWNANTNKPRYIFNNGASIVEEVISSIECDCAGTAVLNNTHSTDNTHKRIAITGTAL